MPPPDGYPSTAESRWQRFSRDWLLSCIFYPAGALASFYVLIHYSGLDLPWCILLTIPATGFFFAPVIFFGSIFLLDCVGMLVVGFITIFRRYSWIRPFYLRHRKRVREHYRWMRDAQFEPRDPTK